MQQTESRLRGLRVLVVEDEYFLAEALTEELAAQGARIVGPASTVRDALALIDGAGGVDAAILDVNLGGELAYPVADRLLASQAAVVFTTGYDASALPARFRGAKSCAKPYAVSAIVDALLG